MEQKSIFTPVIENLKQVDFNVTPVFYGIYDRPIIIDNPNAIEGKDKSFKLFRFIDVVTGEAVTVPSNYTIEKGIEQLEEKHFDFALNVIEIKFMGKTTVKGKPFSQFTLAFAPLDTFLRSLEPVDANAASETKKKK